MNRTTTHSVATTIIATACLTAVSGAAVLYENLPNATNIATNRVSPTLASPNNFALSRVEVTDAGWTIDSITMFFNSTGNWDPATFAADAHVHIVADTDLATFNPTLTTDLVSATATQIAPGSFFGPGSLELTASFPGVSIGPGVYWIGLTPVGDNAGATFNSPGWGFASRATSDASFAYYAAPGGSTGTSTTPSVAETWEIRSGAGDSLSIRVEGIPEPSTALLVLGSGAFLLRRRR